MNMLIKKMNNSSTDYKHANEGWIYCLCNYRDRTAVKIGMTLDIERRMKEANNSFTIEGFYIVIAKFVQKPFQKEQIIHKIFAEYRVSSNREFFWVLKAGVFENILRVFDLVDGRTHPLSKRSLTYRKYNYVQPIVVNDEPIVSSNPIRPTLPVDMSSVESVNEFNKKSIQFAEEFKQYNTQRFHEVFQREFKLTNCDNDILHMNTLSDVMEQNDVHARDNIIVLMQHYNKFPTHTKNGVVYRGVVRKSHVIFKDFEYDSSDADDS
jgi:hypothetical protein